MASDGLWLAVANKDTIDRPAPQADGLPEYGLPAIPAFDTLSSLSVAVTGHEYLFDSLVVVDEIRVFIPVVSISTEYRLYLRDVDNDLLTYIVLPTVEVGENVVLSGSRYITGSRRLRVILAAQDTGSSTVISGDWRYDGINNNNPPAVSGFNVNQQNTIVRIDKLDLGATDRTAELAGIVSGSTARFVQANNLGRFQEFTMTAAGVDIGDYFEFSVVLDGAGDALVIGNACNVTIDVPVAAPTEYFQLDDYWLTNPPYASVTGFKTLGGVEQPSQENNAFGVDIRVTPHLASPDWDIASYSG
jgi:hypothetical protein